MNLNYLILDDEPIAHRIIEQYSRALPLMQLKGNCYSAAEALALLERASVDLIFLDIQMPGLSGFQLLRSLEKPPLVIVVSAHGEYALEGYELEVCDYLLKPFDLERFKAAVARAGARLVTQRDEAGTAEEPRILFKDGRKHHQVAIHQIVYVEACGNYCMVHLPDKTIMARETLSDLESRLMGHLVRVHKSYLVARSRVQVIEGDSLHIGERQIPIGRVYRPNVNRLLSGD